MRLLPVLLVLQLAVPLGVEAVGPVLRGLPLMQRYTPDDYDAGPNNPDLTIDAQGRVVVANQDGVLIQEGAGWRLLRLPGDRAARTVARGPDGRVYVGGIDHFGYLQDTPEGELEFHDLRPVFGLTGDAMKVGVVWQATPTPDGVWFRADHALFFHAMDPARRERIALTQDARAFKAVGDALYGRVQGVGLVKVEGGRLQPQPGAAVFADRALPGVLAWGGDLLLVGIDGFYLADGQGIRRLHSAADDLFGEHTPVAVEALADGSIVVGTRTGEVQRYSRDLRLIERVPLGTQRIHAFAADREGGLWAGTQNGLVRLRMPSRWSRFDETHGLQGIFFDTEWHAGTLWLAGTNGLQRMRADAAGLARAERLPWAEIEAYALRSMPGGLLVGHRWGLFVVDEAMQPQPLISGPSVYYLHPSRFDPGRMFAHGLSDLWMLRLDGTRWTIAAHWPLPDVLARSLAETAPDELWLSDRRGGPQRLRIDPVRAQLIERRGFGPAEGLQVDGEAGTELFLLDGRLHVVSGTRGYQLAGERFIRDESAPFTQVEHPMELRVAETPLGTIALTRRQALRRLPGESEWTSIRFDESVRGYGNLRVASDGVLRIATWGGQLLQYQAGEAEPDVDQPLRVALMRAELRLSDGGVRRLPRAPDPRRLTIPEGAYLSLRVGLATMERDVRFRARLDDTGGGWSEWGASDEINVRWRPGAFVLDVEGRTGSGRQVIPLRLSLQGETAWAQTPMARVLMALASLSLLAVAIGVLLRARTRRLRARIAEQERALEAARQEIRRLAGEPPAAGR